MGSAGKAIEKGFNDTVKTVNKGWDDNIVGDWVNDAVGIASAGFVDLENGKINTNTGDASENFMNSVSLGRTRQVDNSLPPVMSPETQKRIADEKAKKEYETLYGKDGSKSGLQSTVLGGSESKDTSVLKKKKLLGE